MKILNIEWNSYGNKYIEAAFKNNGFSIVSYKLPPDANMKNDEAVCSDVIRVLMESNADFCFSLNYFPIIAIACKVLGKKYISWTYDSPYTYLYSDTIAFPTNYAFIFDKYEFINLRKMGIDTVYYLPMAAPTDFYDKKTMTSSLLSKYDADVAMIGSMYSEKKHRLYDKFVDASPYTHGYLEALIESQKFLYGADIIESALNKDIIDELLSLAPMRLPEDELQTAAWTYTKYFLDREVTRRERPLCLEALSQVCKTVLYTHNATPGLPNVINRGVLDYYDEMPYAMKGAKINLNVSLRSIVTGIPLRAMDIMGCGGFLMTNFQEDFLEFFIPDEDFVFFESPEDLKEKSLYYLAHDDIRLKIASNGYQKVKESHNYNIRIKEMFDIIGE